MGMSLLPEVPRTAGILHLPATREETGGRAVEKEAGTA